MITNEHNTERDVKVMEQMAMCHIEVRGEGLTSFQARQVGATKAWDQLGVSPKDTKVIVNQKDTSDVESVYDVLIGVWTR